MKRVFFLSIAMLGLVAACSPSASSGSPAAQAPVLEAVDLPETIAEQNEHWDVPITFSLHDAAGEPIAAVHIVLTRSRQVLRDETFQISVPAGATRFQQRLAIGGDFGAGPIDVTVSLVERGGAESAPATKTITLQ